jgi:hypothetical protein
MSIGRGYFRTTVRAARRRAGIGVAGLARRGAPSSRAGRRRGARRVAGGALRRFAGSSASRSVRTGRGSGSCRRPTITNTRWALWYGSTLMHCSTSSSNGTIPSLSSQRSTSSRGPRPSREVAQSDVAVVLVLGAVLPRLDRFLRQPAPDGHPEVGSQMPRVITSAASSEEDHRASATWLSAGRSHARRITSARTGGGKVGGLPRRGRSSKPARRCSKNRFRHCETTSRPQRSCAAIWSLRIPSAAINTICARITCQYGNVYERATCSSPARSPSVNSH